MSIDPRPLPHNHTPTSKAAAEHGRARAPSARQRVLSYINDQGADGATMDQVECALDMRHQTVSPRVGELRQDGLIAKTKRTRATTAGEQASVYVGASYAGGQDIIPMEPTRLERIAVLMDRIITDGLAHPRTMRRVARAKAIALGEV